MREKQVGDLLLHGGWNAGLGQALIGEKAAGGPGSPRLAIAVSWPGATRASSILLVLGQAWPPLQNRTRKTAPAASLQPTSAQKHRHAPAVRR